MIVTPWYLSLPASHGWLGPLSPTSFLSSSSTVSRVSLTSLHLQTSANAVPVFTETPWGSQGLTDFFTAYIGIVVFVLLYAFWKIFKRTKMVNPANADIWTGKAALDAEVWPEYVPKNFLEKFWAWLC